LKKNDNSKIGQINYLQRRQNDVLTLLRKALTPAMLVDKRLRKEIFLQLRKRPLLVELLVLFASTAFPVSNKQVEVEIEVWSKFEHCKRQDNAPR
jgi:hypothetical protein